MAQNLKKQAAKVRAAGRRNSSQDTELIHATPEEVALLKKRGGSGRIDPVTGLRHFESGEHGGLGRGGGEHSDDSGGGAGGNGGGGGGDSGGGGDRGEGYATTKLDPNVQAALQAQTALAKDVSPAMQAMGMADPNSIRQSQNLAMGVGGQSGLSGAGYGFDFNKGITASNLANDPNAGYGYNSGATGWDALKSGLKAGLQGLGLLGTATALSAGMPLTGTTALSALNKGWSMSKNLQNAFGGGITSQGMGIDNSGSNPQGPSGMGGASGSDGYATQQMAGFNPSGTNPGGLANQGFQNGLNLMALMGLFGGGYGSGSGMGSLGNFAASGYNNSGSQQPISININANPQSQQSQNPTGNIVQSNFNATAGQNTAVNQNPFSYNNSMFLL